MIAKWDFKESEDFERLYEDIERLKERFGIELHINSYNSLIRKAPSAFIAQRIVAAMPYRDNYTLNLSCRKSSRPASRASRTRNSMSADAPYAPPTPRPARPCRS